MKKNFIYNLISIAVFTGLIFFASTAKAESRLGVQFEKTPLFNEANFLPGETVIRWVKVTNYTGSLQKIVAEAINQNDSDNLAKEFKLVIKEKDLETDIWSGTLADFFAAGEVVLSDLSASAEKQYNFFVTFNPETGNSYQGKKLGFDFLVGFKGQENNNGGGGNGSGGIVTGGGGGGSSYHGLLITGESVANAIQITPEAATLTVTWQTNYSATSQVIYGIDNGSVYSVDLSAPNYGYPNATVDDLTKVMNHSVIVTGLIPGQTYRYRVVSHASPATVSFEHIVTIPKSGNINESINNLNLPSADLALANQNSANNNSGAGVINQGINNLNNSGTVGSSTDEKSTEDNDESFSIEKPNQLLANASSFLTLGTSNNWIAFIVLLAILLAAYFVFVTVSSRKKLVGKK